jgi:hypothetical protein
LLLFQDLKPGDNVLQLPDTPLVFDAPTYGVVHLHQHGTTAGIDRAVLYGASNPIQYDLYVLQLGMGLPGKPATLRSETTAFLVACRIMGGTVRVAQGRYCLAWRTSFRGRLALCLFIRVSCK